MIKRGLQALICALAMTLAVSAVAQTRTLATVKQRGSLNCGINTSLAGFAFPDGGGKWFGMNVDYCRAIAAAIFNDPQKVTYTPVALDTMFSQLKAGEVDILVRNITWTSSREVEGAVDFGPVTYFDGQGFMVKKARKVLTPKGLSGLPVCVPSNSTTELNARDYFRANGLQAKIMVLPTWQAMIDAYEGGQCDALTADLSGLAGAKATLRNPDDHVILSQVISKEPLAPVVRQGDDQWLQIVRWTHFAMVTAEDLGIARGNLDEQLRSSNPEIRRILGQEGRQGEILGLSPDWALRILRHVGNYGESFERNLGRNSPLKFNRGLNGLWSQGGLQYAPPFR
jgi:general L-amino acid transport system substrate-binding protein